MPTASREPSSAGRCSRRSRSGNSCRPAPQLDLGTGVLTVNGTGKADFIVISRDDEGINVAINSKNHKFTDTVVQVVVNGKGGSDSISTNEVAVTEQDTTARSSAPD